MNRNCRVTVIALLALALTACGGGGGGGDDGGPPTGPPPNEAPTADLAASPTSGNAPLEVTLDLTCSDPDGSVEEYRLDWDGDGTFEIAQNSAIQADTTYETEETISVTGQCVDDDGAESSEVTQNVSVEVITRTVQVTGASPEPGEGLVPVAGAYVVTGLQGETARDTLQANAEGEVVIEPVEETGTYEVVVRDELGDGLGDWYDIASPAMTVTAEISSDTDEEYILYPQFPLPPADTIRDHNLDFVLELHGRSVQLPPGAGHPAEGFPQRFWVNPDSAPTQAWVDSAAAAMRSWNGTGTVQTFDNFTAVDADTENDWEIRFRAEIDREGEREDDLGNDINSASISFNTGTLYINPDGLSDRVDDLRPLVTHEASHMIGLNFHEISADRQSDAPYCSNPPTLCGRDDIATAPDDVPPAELKTLEALKVLRSVRGNGYSLLIYAGE